MYKARLDYSILEMVTKLGGRMWSDTTAVAAAGTGTSRVQIENHRVPDAARTLLGWRPLAVSRGTTAAKQVAGIFDISGANYKSQPQQVPAIPTSGNLGAAAGAVGLLDAGEFWDVFYPVNGGELISIGFTPSMANSDNGSVASEQWWSDVRVPLPVIYSLMNTGDALGTAAGASTNITALNINNAHKLIEVDLVEFQNGVLTAGAGGGLGGDLTLKSTVWSPVQQIDVLAEYLGLFAGTAGSQQNHLKRAQVALDFLADRATITGNFTQDQANTVAPSLISGIRWI